MKIHVKLIVGAAAFLLMCGSVIGEPAQATQTIFKNLIAATVSDDYEGFLADCDAQMKAALTKPMLAGVSEQIAPRAKMGYDAQYLGELRQHGYEVYLWRLVFKDGGDDVLATLSMKDGKVGGFFLH